jgi:hypothetical protein
MGVVLIGGFFGDPFLCMVLLSVTGVIFWSWMNLYLLKMGGVPVRDAVREILRFLVLGIIVSLPLLIAKILSLSLFLVFIIAISVTILYYLIVVYQDPQLKDGLIDFLKNLIPKND